jgi:type IV secretory pathway VirD2 relaxase
VSRSGPPDDDGIIRPRMGRRNRSDQERVPAFLFRLARTAPRWSGTGTRGQARNQPGRVAVREPRALSRRCVIKSRYVPMTASGRKLAARHLAYLERDGVERDGSPGRLYGPDEKFSSEEFRERLAAEKRQFRFIVSPEDDAQVDLSELARQLMRQVEKDTGRRLIWAAVNHYNTDNPHVHIVVRGVDRDGDDFRIDRGYMAHGMRWRAQEIVTRELGRRSEMDVSMGWAIDVGRDAFTEIDRAIAEHSSPDGAVSLARLLAAPERERLACLDRLQALEEMQLATKESANVWRLAEGWKEFLVHRGEDNEARSRLRALVGDEASRYQVLRPENPVPVADGVVVGMGLHDELGGDMFAAIKTASGQGYYLRLPPSVAEKLQERDAVRVGFEVEPWLKPADRIVARFAQENGGTYDPVRHQRELEGLRQSPVGDGQPTPAERVAANVRRLERLARYRLATRLPDGRWQIPADLLSQLENRERTHPQHRFRFVKLVGGPTREPVRAQTQDVVSEREALGRALSKDLGLAYVAEPPAFRGRVMACAPTPSGREYVQIVDYRTGQFTLIAKSPEAERLDGRTVQLTRDRGRELSLQIDRGISR